MIEIGLKHTSELTVTDTVTAIQMGSGDMPVLATPAMLALMENAALLTDVFNTRRWDISSDNPVYTLVNNSKNRSRIFWLGISWNFHSYKPVGGAKKQEEDRSIIKLGE